MRRYTRVLIGGYVLDAPIIDFHYFEGIEGIALIFRDRFPQPKQCFYRFFFPIAEDFLMKSSTHLAAGKMKPLRLSVVRDRPKA
jgi:hypothetical protein